MTERWRCFVAVRLGDELRARLAQAMDAWRGDPRTEGLRWVAPNGLHVTLAFLGAVDQDVLGGVETTIRDRIAGHAPMALATGRLGAFARPGSARVLWYGIGDPDGNLAALASDLSEALGVPSDEALRPHVTLARARHRSVDLRGWIEAASAAAPEGVLRVDGVHLLRSHLGHGPARYETLASFTLGGGQP